MPKNASASVDSDSDANRDDKDSDNHTMDSTLRRRKRKRSPPASTVSHKRHSQTLNHTSKQHLEHAIYSARRQKPSSFRGTLRSNRPSAPQYGSCDVETHYRDYEGDENSEETSDHDHLRKTERPKLTANLDHSCRYGKKRGRSTVRPPPSTIQSAFNSPILPQSHPPPRQAQRQLPNIVIYPLSSSTEFLTAIFRTCSNIGILSTNQAVSLLENQVGHEAEPENITITPLVPGTWFLTCFLFWPPDVVNAVASCGEPKRAGSHIDQPAPALPGLLATRTDSAAVQGDDMSSDDNIDRGLASDADIDVEKSSEDEEYVSDVDGDTPSSPRKHEPWSLKDDNNLFQWKEKGKSWDWICRQFKSRSPRAVKTH